MKGVLKSLRESEQWLPITLNFSGQTTSKQTQDILELKMEKKMRFCLGGPVGKRVCVFVDDVNMPRLDTYGSQPPIELLRQVLDFSGFYDRKKLIWKSIEDVVLTAACAPPGGGRNPLSQRFIRHFAMLMIPIPTEASLQTIFKYYDLNYRIYICWSINLIDFFQSDRKRIFWSQIVSSIGCQYRGCNSNRSSGNIRPHRD